MKRRRELARGWQGWDQTQAAPWANPRPPAVPLHLQLDLKGYFTAAALIGFLAAQRKEPNKKFTCEWSREMGAMMAKSDERRRKKRKKPGRE